MGEGASEKSRRLVDMGQKADLNADSAPFVYMPSVDAVDGVDYPVLLGDGCMLSIRTRELDSRIVDFALNQYVTRDYPANYSNQNHDVARIDCCHSRIHRHQFHRDRAQSPQEVIADLSQSPSQLEAELTIHSHYDECYLLMIDNWELYLERWEK